MESLRTTPPVHEYIESVSDALDPTKRFYPYDIFKIIKLEDMLQKTQLIRQMMGIRRNINIRIEKNGKIK